MLINYQYPKPNTIRAYAQIFRSFYSHNFIFLNQRNQSGRKKTHFSKQTKWQSCLLIWPNENFKQLSSNPLLKNNKLRHRWREDRALTAVKATMTWGDGKSSSSKKMMIKTKIAVVNRQEGLRSMKGCIADKQQTQVFCFLQYSGRIRVR